MDTIKSVAGTAGTAGVVWICVHYIVQLLTVIAAPICWAVSVVMVARYASTLIGSKVQTASADEVEKTKQKQVELERSKVELEKSTAETAKNSAIKQLCRIASSAGVSHSQYSGIYNEDDVKKIVDKVKKNDNAS